MLAYLIHAQMERHVKHRIMAPIIHAIARLITQDPTVQFVSFRMKTMF